MMSSSQQNESIPLVKQTINPQPKIRKFPASGNENEIKLLEFGPFYCKDDSESRSFKDDAWKHVVKRSPDREAVTTELYLGAVRRVEKQARETYAAGENDAVLNNLTGSQFRWMMIKDGCCFLQLAMFILGGSEHLGYSSDHEIFGKKPNLRWWIQSMFFVGNQIPLILLRELLKQSFFQQVIKARGKWEQPKENLCKIVLYHYLFLPSSPQASDILHGLYLLVVGPEIKSKEADDDQEEDEEEEDLEAQLRPGLDQEGQEEAVLGPVLPIADEEEFIVIRNVKDMKFASAAKLRQAGIHYKLVEDKGSRGINFFKNMFRASLTMPPFFVDQYTEILFQNLKDYEITQSLGENEVNSYLRFMSELIRTPEDAKQLAKKSIIRGRHKHKDKLPEILGRLAPRELYNQHFRLVKIKVNDYSRPPWAYLRKYVEFAVFLTLIQTVYAVLSYHKPAK